jgi:hypothetical protein
MVAEAWHQVVCEIIDRVPLGEYPGLEETANLNLCLSLSPDLLYAESPTAGMCVYLLFPE